MRDFFERKVNIILSSILGVLFVAFIIVMLFSGGASPGDDNYVPINSSTMDTATETTAPATEEPTTEPDATEETTVPATTQPATTQPATTQPVAATQPATTQPATVQPATRVVKRVVVSNNSAAVTTTTTKTTTVTTVVTTTDDDTSKEKEKEISNNKDNKKYNTYTNNSYLTTTTNTTTNHYYTYYYANSDKNVDSEDYKKQWEAGYLIAIDKPDSNYKCGKVNLSDSDRSLLENFCMSKVGNDYIASALIAQTVKNSIYFDNLKTVKDVLEEYYAYTYSDKVKVEKNCKDAVAFIFDENKDVVMKKINYFEKEELAEKDKDYLVVQYAKINFFNF